MNCPTCKKERQARIRLKTDRAGNLACPVCKQVHLKRLCNHVYLRRRGKTGEDRGFQSLIDQREE